MTCLCILTQNGFAISRLKWDGVVNNSGTTGYSDFKNIKICLCRVHLSTWNYDYQTRRPLTRDLTTIPGVLQWS
jgi:hypothetical protein